VTTDFNKNVLSTKGGFKPNNADTPLDIRTRVETEADIMSIPKPFIGMEVFVKDTGKRYEVLSLKDSTSGLTTIENGAVDTYKELILSYDDTELRGLLDSKANKSEIPSIEGLATKEFVNQQIESIGGGNVDAYTKEEVDEIVNDFTDGKKQRYLTQAEYDLLSDDEKNMDDIVYNITDAEDKELTSRSNSYFIDLEKWGIHNGFIEDRGYVLGDDGKYLPKYTDEEYDIAHNNKEGLNAALQYAVDNGYNSAVLPNGSEIFVCWENPSTSTNAYYGYNKIHIVMPSNLIFDMNNSTIKVIFDSKNLNPYDKSQHSYDNPIYRMNGHLITMNACYNSTIKNGTLLGTLYDRAFIIDSENEVSSEQNFDFGVGINIGQGSSFIKIENMKIKGFMADGIASMTDHDPAMGNTLYDPPFNNANRIDTSTGNLVDGGGATFCTDLLDISGWKCKEGIMRTNIGYYRVPDIHKETFYVFFYDENQNYLLNTRTRYLQNFIVPEKAKYLRIMINREEGATVGFNKGFQITPKAGEFCTVSYCEITENHRGGIANMVNNTIIEKNKIYNNGLGRFEGVPTFGDSTRYCINCEDCLPLNIIIRDNYFYESFHGILFAGGTITCENNTYNNVTGSALHIYNCETAFFNNNTMINSGGVGTTGSSVYDRTLIMRDNIYIGQCSVNIRNTNNLVHQISGITMNGTCSFINSSTGIPVKDIIMTYSRFDDTTYIGGICDASNCENVFVNLEGKCNSTAKFDIISNENTKNFIVKNISTTEDCTTVLSNKICNAKLYDLGQCMVRSTGVDGEDGIRRIVGSIYGENIYMRNIMIDMNTYSHDYGFLADFKFKNSTFEMNDTSHPYTNRNKLICPYQYGGKDAFNTYDIEFENCNFNFNHSTTETCIISGNGSQLKANGQIVFRNCHFKNTSEFKMRLYDLLLSEDSDVTIIIDNCTYEGSITASESEKYTFYGKVIKDGVEIQPGELL